MSEIELEDLDGLIAEGDLGGEGEDDGEDAGPGVEGGEVETPPADDEGELAEEDADDDASGELLGEEEGEDEGDEPEDELDDPEEDPRDQEIQRLKADVVKQTEQVQELLALVQQQRAPKPAAPQGPDPQLREAVSALLMSGDEDERKRSLQSLPRSVTNRAVQLIRDREAKRVEYLLNPGARYRDEQAPFVEAQIHEAIRPLVEHIQRGKVSEILKRHEGVVKTQSDREAVAEILDTLPTTGWKGGIEERYRVATDLFRLKAERESLQEEKQKLSSRERDMKARKAARRGSGRSRPKRGRKKAPELGKDWDVASLYSQIAQDEAIDQEELDAFFGS